MRQFSIVTRISVALACIMTLAIGTMLVSYWISDKADSDAQAINIAGSLRMQSYRIGWLSQQPDTDALQQASDKLQQSWQHPVFNRVLHNNANVSGLFTEARQQWRIMERQLTTADAATLNSLLVQQIDKLDQLVMAIQQDAEQKVRALRLVQVVALFLTVLLSFVIMHWLKVKVEQPLTELTSAARRIGHGDFTCRVTPQQQDELGELAQALNKMSDAIGYMYGNLEKRVDEQTHALQQRNTTLTFLFNTARRISEHAPDYKDFSAIVDELKGIVQVENIELCLITEQGSSPYLQIMPQQSAADPCAASSCGDCLSEQGVRECDGLLLYNYPLNRDRQHYGVLVARTDGVVLAQWQHQLLSSVADQLALALSLKSEEEQVRRLALMQERTVIARELHDSLAQALSYLKIQVTRLNKALQKEDKATIDDVSNELKQGLDAAYRQLRELLTTFRLKVDGAGLLSALQTTVQQLSEQSELQIQLDYQLSNTPLAPHEEIHLLQIIREASQNAMHHSKGQHLLISLHQQPGQAIELAVEDDGVGIPQSAEKLNHYGLAIMQERSRHLGGSIDIKRRAEGGTGVYFSFLPEYLQQKQSA